MLIEKKQIEFEGVPVAYWEGGNGEPLLLLHGSGPGAGSVANWRLVIDQLAKQFHVIAPDLIGFGESGRKPVRPYFDVDLWLRQAAFMLDQFGALAVNVLAHSLSGALALKLAIVNAKVKKVMTTGSIGSRMPANEHLDIVWTFPATRDAIIKAGRTLVFDESLVTEEYIVGREKILYSGDYKSYFESLFEGDKQQYLDAVVIPDEQLAAVDIDVLMLHGVNDLPIPIESTYRLARQIPRADVVALARCGHSVALEHPQKLINFAAAFFLPRH